MKEDEVFNHSFENAERIGYLVASYIKGTLTPLERKELDEWILQSEKNELLFDELTSDENIEKTMQWYAAIDEEKALQRIKKKMSFPRQRKGNIPLSLITIAASIILVIGAAVFFVWQTHHSSSDGGKSVLAQKEILPGTNKAILTLGDGAQIVLDGNAPKSLADGSIKIDEGKISYDSTLESPPKENLLSVPRGGQFMIFLSDGTKVWLNAESSLRYTTSFIGKERRVALTGEGYFEVAKNKEKPFIVESPAGTVKVLGTHFNINAYGDDNTSVTTLLEGSVEISKDGISKILKPGQQARVTSKQVDIVDVDTREAIAWKDGEFLFRNTPVATIVNQLARWYNLDVEFKDPVDKHLNATIQRNVSLSKVLHYLEQTGDVHFKLDGRKLIISK